MTERARSARQGAGRQPQPSRAAPAAFGNGDPLRGKAATIQDVANEAGVSRAAVSKVIRDAYGVSPQMRKRVEAAIERLNYRPRVAARAMRGASFTLGLQIPEIGNDFHSVIATGAADALIDTPYQLIIAPIRDPGQDDKTLENLADRQVDGIIAVAPLVSTEWLDRLALRVPLVMVGRHDTSTHYDTVAGDDQRGADSVMEHLIELGHRRIAFLGVEPDQKETASAKPYISRTGRDPHSIRRRAYQEHMGALDLPPLFVGAGGLMESDAAEATRRLLELHPDVTAIFAGHDTLAIGALRTMAISGVDTSSLSVAGFDDVPIANHPLISLTSVAQRGYEMGRVAVRLLLERMEGRTRAESLQMPTELKIRRTTNAPRTR